MFAPVRNLKNKNSGFTLVELLVTISIFVILTGIVVFNQGKFNSTILLTNLAYDTALNIREAQTYGVNVKEFNGENKFVPYGVHFSTTDPLYYKSFILFADLDYTPATETSDGIYNGPDGNSTPDYSKCEIDEGCVSRYNIQRGSYILALCKGEVLPGEKKCQNDADIITSLNIVFKRPNVDAKMKSDDVSSPEYTVATIVLSAADGGGFRKVRVASNGLIEIVK